MIDETRKRLLDELVELSARCPQLRFGQLVANLAASARGPDEGSIWNAEDEELLAAASRQVKYWSERVDVPVAVPA